jgi:hypothetical protein
MFGMGGFRNDGRGLRDAKRVQPCGDGAGGGVATYVSLRVPENSLDLGQTDRLGRTIQCSRRAVLSVDRLLADLLHPVETYIRR